MPSPLEGEISLDISLNFCWPFLQGPASWPLGRSATAGF